MEVGWPVPHGFEPTFTSSHVRSIQKSHFGFVSDTLEMVEITTRI